MAYRHWSCLYHVNGLCWRFTKSTKYPRWYSQLPKVRLASRSQRAFSTRKWEVGLAVLRPTCPLSPLYISSFLLLEQAICHSRYPYGNKSSQIFNCRFKSKICDLDSLISVYSNNLYFTLYFL
ncbi:hypothetical protein ALC56_07238 [Trachymyrmex septentrionalis]|uniref:Uncharacterized protein n=1 Tax=Trachymyrmex septentrionalis TaxID=34720 RepID=A0A195FCR3_9HYME|nr:hypothetical protein ALC56_07238 [Trachymyrmex septentrionalis]